MALTEETT